MQISPFSLSLILMLASTPALADVASDDQECFDTTHQQCMDRKVLEEKDCKTRERRSECVAECRDEARNRCSLD